ncbi:MAG: hypothetical protein AAF394_03795 [Planctomycetota bacterium]
MSHQEAGSCKENGLFGFLSKLIDNSADGELSEDTGEIRDFLGRGLSDEVSEALDAYDESQQQSLWDDLSELYADPLQKKGLTADPNASYGLLGFMGVKYDKQGNYSEAGQYLTLKLTGKFPNAQYMSMQIYRGQPFQTSEDVGDVLSDFEIQANNGTNPFQTGVPEDEGDFEIFITPNKNKEKCKNHIYYEPRSAPSRSAVISGFYRVYLPEGQEITKADLPRIEAFDEDGDQVKPRFVQLIDTWYPRIPGAKLASNLVIPERKTLPWINLDCVSSGNPSGLGSSHDLQYIGSFSKVPYGKYVAVEFRAPALYFGPPHAVENPAVRYWSVCSVYFPTLTTMNSLACAPDSPEARNVKLIFGKDRPGARAQAGRLGAEFLPDTRESDDDVLTIMLRNLLATRAFKPQAYKGNFAPRGKVYSLRELMELEPGDELT